VRACCYHPLHPGLPAAARVARDLLSPKGEVAKGARGGVAAVQRGVGALAPRGQRPRQVLGAGARVQVCPLQAERALRGREDLGHPHTAHAGAAAAGAAAATACAHLASCWLAAALGAPGAVRPRGAGVHSGATRGTRDQQERPAKAAWLAGCPPPLFDLWRARPVRPAAVAAAAVHGCSYRRPEVGPAPRGT
jgi:hypothetical protein